MVGGELLEMSLWKLARSLPLSLASAWIDTVTHMSFFGFACTVVAHPYMGGDESFQKKTRRMQDIAGPESGFLPEKVS